MQKFFSCFKFFLPESKIVCSTLLLSYVCDERAPESRSHYCIPIFASSGTRPGIYTAQIKNRPPKRPCILKFPLKRIQVKNKISSNFK